MECLEKVNKREADFVAVDPEDMYVAFHMDNEDFSVFSEIRTAEEPEGIQKCIHALAHHIQICSFSQYFQLNFVMRESF